MTYDPREGSSPYLGMDASDNTDERQLSASQPLQHAPQRTPDIALTTPTVAGEPFKRVPRQPHEARVQPDRTAVAQQVPATVRRSDYAQPAPARRDERILRRPVRVEAPVPSPPQQPRQAPRASAAPRAGSRFSSLLAGFLLHVAAFGLRLLALVFSAFVIASAVLTDSHRLALVRALNLTAGLVPPAMMGRLVYETPFGGALRGDLIVMALVLFVADWACLRMAQRLRIDRERGV